MAACVIREANMASLVVCTFDRLARYALINPYVFVLLALDGCRINRSNDLVSTCQYPTGIVLLVL